MVALSFEQMYLEYFWYCPPPINFLYRVSHADQPLEVSRDSAIIKVIKIGTTP